MKNNEYQTLKKFGKLLFYLHKISRLLSKRTHYLQNKRYLLVIVIGFVIATAVYLKIIAIVIAINFKNSNNSVYKWSVN
jgi:hypothetical protein